MGQDTTEIRREIEATRARMGETVEAIGYKADVPSRLRDNVNDRIESVKGTIGNAVGTTKNKVFGTASDFSDAASDSLAGMQDRAQQAGDSTRQAVSLALENPLGLLIGALAVGFLGGLMVPTLDIERERIGPVRDLIAERSQSVMSEAVEAGKAVLNDTLTTAAQSAQQHGKEVAQHAMATGFADTATRAIASNA